MRDATKIEAEIRALVERYARVQKRAGGDCDETKRLEGMIDGLEIELKNLKESGNDN